MAYTVQDILSLVNFIQNKTQAGDTLSVTEFNTILPAVNLNYFTTVYKNYEVDENVMDTLSFLKVQSILTVNPATGQAAKPSSYLHISSIDYSYATYDKKGVQYIKRVAIPRLSDNQISVRITNPITKGTKKQPFCQLLGNSFQFYPFDLGVVNLLYLRYPVTPFYGATYNSATDEFVYDPATSVQPEYPDIDILNFTWHVLQYIGVNLQMPIIENFSKLMQSQYE